MYPNAYQNKDDDQAVYFFSSPFDALNNWSAHAVEAYDRVFHTLEHAYHFKKFADHHPHIANQIHTAPSPWAAMRIAKEHRDKVRDDWHEIKVAVMEELVRKKLAQNADVADVLRKTGKRKIVENSPWDDFWGAGPDDDGKNMVGVIWMKVRDDLL